MLSEQYGNPKTAAYSTRSAESISHHVEEILRTQVLRQQAKSLAENNQEEGGRCLKTTGDCQRDQNIKTLNPLNRAHPVRMRVQTQEPAGWSRWLAPPHPAPSWERKAAFLTCRHEKQFSLQRPSEQELKIVFRAPGAGLRSAVLFME